MEIFLRCDMTGRLLWIPWDVKGNKSFLFIQPYVQKDFPLLFCEYALEIEQDFLDILYYFCSTEIFFVSRVKLFGNCYIRQLFQAIVLHVPDIVSNFRHRPSIWKLKHTIWETRFSSLCITVKVYVHGLIIHKVTNEIVIYRRKLCMGNAILCAFNRQGRKHIVIESL